MKINYVISTYNGSFPYGKRDYVTEDKQSFVSPNEVLKFHLTKLSEIKHNLSQITIMKPHSDNVFKDYYNIDDIINKFPKDLKIEIKECQNFGYSVGQFLKAYEIYQNDFDYYCFIEDDYCANMDNFDLIFKKIYQEDFSNNIGLLCSVIEGSKDYKTKGGYPIHFEGMVFVSTKTLEKLYSDPQWGGNPRLMLDNINSSIDNGFNWEQQRNSYMGGYYQLTFSHLFTLSGIDHSHYLKRLNNHKELEFPYWSDDHRYPLGGYLKFYDSSIICRNNFTQEDINNSPIIPIQLSNDDLKTSHLNNQPLPKIIFLIGMHRCGTSLLSNCLVENGWDIGKTKNQDKNWQNPNGYFENDLFTDFHNKLLEYNGCLWNYLPKDNLEYTQSHVEEYRKLLSKEFHKGKILIKDPRLTFFQNFLKEVCDGLYQPYFIFCTRDKKECCNSLTLAQGIPYKTSEFLYDKTHQYFNSECLPINHRDVIYNNTQVMNVISSFCQINLDLDTSGIVDLNLYRNRIFS